MTGNRPSRSRRSLEAAEGYLLLEMSDHALAQLNAVPDDDEYRFELYHLRGEALRNKQQHEQALEAYERALAERPDDLSVLMGMAWCYKRTDQLPRAIESMREAHRHAPKEPIVLYNLSCYYALAGDKSQTLAWLGRALRMEKSLRQLIPAESDFDRLRDDPDFQFVLSAGTVDDA